MTDTLLGAVDVQIVQVQVAGFSQGQQPGWKKMLGDFMANTLFCSFLLKLYVTEQ